MFIAIDLVLFFSSASAFLVMLLGLFVYLSDRKSIVNRLFLALCVSVLFWIISVILVFFHSNPLIVLYSARGAFVFAILISFFLACFTYKFPINNIYRIPKRLLLLFVVLALAFILSPYVVSNVNLEPELSITYGWGYYLFIAVFVMFVLGSIYNLLVKIRKVEETEQLQIQYMIVGFFTSIALGFTTNILIKVLTGVTDISVLGPLSSIPFIFLTSIAILKYRLFNIKVIATELLVFSLWIFTLLRTLVSQTLNDFLINGSFFVVTVIIGIFLIKSVIQEVKTREKTESLNQALTERKNKLERLTKKLQEANQHLKELMTIKTEFLQIASHQLRTPLTSLRGFLTMQDEGDLDKMSDKDRKGMQHDMVTVANNLNNIVNDLLHATELEGGNINFDLEKVQVQDLIEDAVTTFKSSYEKKGLTITFTRNEDLPEIEADDSYLRQVFLNIINNAEKYTEEGGLTITTDRKDDHIEVVFTDTGTGIAPEDRDKLFGKFVRGEKAALMHTDGSGLGLYIIKKIIDAHHGEVILESEGVNKGTTVRVVLPIKQPE